LSQVADNLGHRIGILADIITNENAAGTSALDMNHSVQAYLAFLQRARVRVGTSVGSLHEEVLVIAGIPIESSSHIQSSGMLSLKKKSRAVA
jgi:hypothetical protein